MPPFDPLHDHVHGPVPDTAVAVPDAHKFDEGADVVPVPFAEPHEPFTDRFALQFAVVPPLTPAHVHVHGPVPPTADAVPTEHRFDEGAV